MTTSTTLVHESDAQRHHVRVQLPAKMIINDVSYDVKDWSTAGVRLQIKGKIDANIFKEKKIYDVKMLFDFVGYSLSIPFKIEICYIKDEDDCVGIRYIELNNEQTSIMQHLVSSYVTGELTSVGDLINVTGRNNFTKSRQLPEKADNNSASERMKRSLRKLFIFFISLFLLIYVAIGIYEQSYVISAQSAVITADNFSVNSSTGGILNYKKFRNGDKVMKGDMLLTVTSETGTITGIDSPCNCIIDKILLTSGTEVSKNTSVISMIPENAKFYIEAYVPYKKAIRITEGQFVHLGLAGSRLDMSGIIKTISVDETIQGVSKLIIHTKDNIPSSLIGTPAEVRIDTLGWTN